MANAAEARSVGAAVVRVGMSNTADELVVLFLTPGVRGLGEINFTPHAALQLMACKSRVAVLHEFAQR